MSDSQLDLSPLGRIKRSDPGNFSFELFDLNKDRIGNGCLGSSPPLPPSIHQGSVLIVVQGQTVGVLAQKMDGIPAKEG